MSILLFSQKISSFAATAQHILIVWLYDNGHWPEKNTTVSCNLTCLFLRVIIIHSIRHNRRSRYCSFLSVCLAYSCKKIQTYLSSFMMTIARVPCPVHFFSQRDKQAANNITDFLNQKIRRCQVSFYTSWYRYFLRGIVNL